MTITYFHKTFGYPLNHILVFDKTERQPRIVDKELIRNWEKVENLPEEEKRIVKALLEGMILKHEAKRCANV
ncbi:MAG: hypothetical protein ACK5NT_04020 [Pyrinomonadaceae bacterium]